MNRFLAGIKKEILLLLRDLPGLAILFLMPVVLIMIVSLAQQNALKSSKEQKTPLLFLDQSGSYLSRDISKNLNESGLFQIIDEKDPVSFTTGITSGKFQAGIRIKEQDSAILLVTDPALQPSFRATITASVTYIIKGTQSRQAIERLLKSMAPAMGESIDKMISSSVNSMTPVQQITASSETAAIKPTLTQNLIPGFILFAMFFIVLPLSGSVITEKNEGTYFRLMVLPVSILSQLGAKVLVYLVVCMLQFMLMVFTGLWMLPHFFGIPALQLGDQYFLIIIATLAAGLAATGFGILVGSVATTNGQASVFGSMTVVILGVISGTFLPVYLMPEFLQKISSFSPIRWGIENYLNIFIRGGGIRSVIPEICYLLAFFTFSILCSIYIFKRTK